MGSVSDHGRSAQSIFSVPQIVTLVGSIVVSICSGSGYIYSAYAPQMAARLHMTQTQLNIIAVGPGMAGDFIGPVWGRIVDSRGPRIALVTASITLFAGYAGIKCIYDRGIGSDTLVPLITLLLVIFSHMLVGFGSCAGGAAAINMTAKRFPESARGTTTSLVASGFGLSAFCYSAFASTFFPGDTSALLLVLALGTAIPTFITLFVVRPAPLAQPPLRNEISRNKVVSLNSSEIDMDERSLKESELPLLEDEPENDDDSDDLSESIAFKMNRGDEAPNIHGKQLWMCQDSYILILIITLLCGTGVMYINNVGSISHALYANSNPNYNEAEASEWQTSQVSTLSVCNFAGRVFIGLVSDFIRNRLDLPRSYCLCLVSILFIISQATAISVTSVNTLWIATTVLGVAYGSLWGIIPTINIEWFGLEHMSENAGYLYLASSLPANLFSIMFGRDLDAHTSTFEEELLSSGAADSVGPLRWLLRRQDEMRERQCLIGRECYVTSLRVTFVACVVALAISTWAAIRDGRRDKALRQRAAEEHGYIELGERLAP